MRPSKSAGATITIGMASAATASPFISRQRADPVGRLQDAAVRAEIRLIYPL